MNRTRRWLRLPARYDHLDVVTTTVDAHGRVIALLASPKHRFGRTRWNRKIHPVMPYVDEQRAGEDQAA